MAEDGDYRTPVRSAVPARLILLALAALFVSAEYTLANRPSHNGLSSASAPSDGDMFEAVVTRIRHGEPYYRAMGVELRQRNYPTASAFNWRTPLFYLAIASLPRGVAYDTLVSLALFTVVFTAVYLTRIKATSGILLAIMTQTGAAVLVFTRTIQVQSELACGILVTISVIACLYERRILGALIAIGALFVRELAAPYCAVCMISSATAHRSKGEIGIWSLGLLSYAVYYGVHILHVWAQHQPGDLPHPHSWVQFGGFPFLIDTIQQTNGLLLVGPNIATSIVVTLLGAALFAPTIPMLLRATVVVYLGFFAIVGQPFNSYWGLVTAPIYPFALAYAPNGLTTLWQRARVRLVRADHTIVREYMPIRGHKSQE
jgi:hypothetical protein